MNSFQLPVVLACEDLAISWFKRTEKFPRHHKHGLGQESLATIRGILSELLHAHHSRPADRSRHRHEANVLLDLFRFDLRLCVETGILSPKAQEHLLAQCHELGQQIGGWTRACEKGAARE